MRRRALIALAAAAAALRSFRVGAQLNRVPIIGYIGVASVSQFARFTAAFHQGLAETGFVEGRNVAVEYRWAEGRGERLDSLIEDLVRRNVDIIVTSGGVLATFAAKRATSTIPIVFETGIDPVASGLVASLARPGGNLTGIMIMTAELNPKRFELLSELVPQALVVAVLVNPQNGSAEHVISAVQAAARARRVEAPIVNAAGLGEFEAAFASLPGMRAGGLLVANDPVFFGLRGDLVALAARYAIPAIYEWREFVEIGGLISYGTSLADMYRQKGVYAGRILAGTKPGDLPVEQPTKFELVINLKTAKTLGLTVPQSILARADEVIE